MKIITALIVILLLFTGCITTQKTKDKYNTYICAKNLIELDAQPEEAMRFCEKTFRDELQQ